MEEKTFTDQEILDVIDNAVDTLLSINTVLYQRSFQPMMIAERYEIYSQYHNVFESVMQFKIDFENHIGGDDD